MSEKNLNKQAETTGSSSEVEGRANLEQIAQGTFDHNWPLFLQHLETLSKKQTQRVISSLIAVPFLKPSINTKNQDEMMAYGYGERCMEAKFLLLNKILLDEQENIDKQLAENTEEKKEKEDA